MVKSDRWLRANLPWADPDLINPASVDIRLGEELKVFSAGHGRRVMNLREIGHYDLIPGEMALAHSIEYVTCPSGTAALLILKSSRGREGLDHAHSGWFDPGWHGQATLELYANALPVRLSYGMKIAQLVYFDCEEPERDYTLTGHYAGQTGATESVHVRLP